MKNKMSMNPKTNRLLMSLVLGLGLTAAALGLLSGSIACAADLPVCFGDCIYDAIQGAVDTPRSHPANHGRPASVILNQGRPQNLSNPIAENTIAIDNTREGWENAVPYPDDPAGDGGDSGNIDWITITMAHDSDELYLRYQVDNGPPFDPDNAFNYSLFIDVDRDRNTGFIGASDQLAIGADVLFQGRRTATGEVKASVFHFTGGAGRTEWLWSSPISDNPVDDQILSGDKRDIEWKTRISDLDVFGQGVTGFHWVATQGGGANDYDPDGGNGGAGGDFFTYTLALPNPERGLFHATETHSNNYTPLVLDTLQGYREKEGVTLIHRMFYLEDFVESDISQAYLDNMTTDFDIVRQAGLKMVVRFAYTSGADLDAPYNDASKEWIITHIKQLSKVLRENSDVIATMEAGFIGLWGEWWYSDYFQPDGDWDDRRDVLFAILNALPASRTVQLRAPRYKYNIFSDTVVYSGTIPSPAPLPVTQAHTGSYLARTGHHNDCFLSSASDYGTYVYTPTEYRYLEEETRYVVMGGETCNPGFAVDPNLDRLKCETALKELAQFHWSFLNLDWYTPTLHSWREDGCFSEIEGRLGYRLALLQQDFPAQIRAGEDLQFSLQIKNEGFAAPFNPRAVELILRHTNDATYTFTLPDDPRFWLPGITHTLSYTITLPSNLPLGSYDLLLNLPDPALYRRSEYAIRLINQVTWEASTGYNKLNHALVVTALYLPVIFKSN